MDKSLKRAFIGSIILILISITALLFKMNELRAELLMSISGKVIDYETGKGIPDATVKIFPYNWTKTDKDGNFTIKDLSEGRYEVKIGSTLASLPDYYVPYKYPKYIEVKSGKNITNVNIYVKRGATVSGRILADDGKTPIREATVYIRSKETDFYNEVRREAFSDENGRYRIEGLMEEYSFDIIVERVYGYADERKENIRIKGKKEIANVDIIMGKRSKIVVRGKVLSSKGKTPVKGAQIFFMKTQLAGFDSGWALTDSNGEFQIKGLTSGSYDIGIIPGPEELMKYESKSIKGFQISEGKRNYIKVFLEPRNYIKDFLKLMVRSLISKIFNGISATMSQIFQIKGKHFEVIAEWGKEGGLVGLKDMCVDNQGNIYVLTWTKVKKFNREGKLLKEWGKRGTGDGEFYEPVGIAVDNNSNIYVLEGGGVNPRVQKFDSEGNFILKWGKRQSDKDYYAGKISPGEFYCPRGITVDWEGNIYVWNKAVQKFDPSGKFISAWKGHPWFTVDLVFDREGNFYTLDLYEKSAWDQFIRVQKFNREGKRVAQILEKQKVYLNFPPDPLNPTDPEFFPGSLAVDSKGNIYVQKSNKETWLTKYSLVQGEYKLQWKEKIYGGIKIDRHDNFYFISSKRIQKIRIKD